MKYRYHNNCVSWDRNDVHCEGGLSDMIGDAKLITRKTFLKHVDYTDLKNLEADLGYNAHPNQGLTMAGDWHVGYHRSKLHGQRVYFFTYSGIEYVFTPEDCQKKATEIDPYNLSAEYAIGFFPSTMSESQAAYSENGSDDAFWEDLVSGKFTKRVVDSSVRRKFSSPKDVFNVMRPIAATHPDREVMYGFFLNRQNEVLAMRPISIGSVSGASVYPREVLKQCIETHATALIIVHNHPSGHNDPSPQDLSISKTLVFATRSIGVSLHDHIITGNDDFFSMADNGLVENWSREAKRMLNI